MNEKEKEQIKDMYLDCDLNDLPEYNQHFSKNDMPDEAHNKAMRMIELDDNHRGDGGATNYYNLPKGATILNDLILHKDMRHGIGEAFCAIYRLHDNGEYLRNLKKVKFYIDAAIEYEEVLKQPID